MRAFARAETVTQEVAIHGAIGCPGCGSAQLLPELPDGGTSHCAVCATVLERADRTSLAGATALAVATFLLLIPANLLPLYRVELLAGSRGSHVVSGASLFWREGFPLPAIAMLLFVVILPLVRFGLLSAVLLNLWRGRRPAWLGHGFHIAQLLAVWSMPEVMLLGIYVAYGRLEALFDLQVEAGAFFMGAATLGSLLTRALVNRRAVWRAIMPDRPLPAGAFLACEGCDLLLPATGEQTRCPRCHAKVMPRTTDSMATSAALVAAGLVLYIPANFLPMALTLRFGAPSPYTVLEGVIELAQANLFGLAVLVFCASFAIPLLKLAGMGWLLWSVRSGSTSQLQLKTRLHRIIHEIGRWSMVDVLAIGTFVPLMQFDQLANAQAMPGMTAFLGVVIMTMLATHSFDPRLLWDGQAHRGGRERAALA